MVEWKNIGDISLKLFAGGTPSTNHDEYYDGDIPWIRSGEIDFNVINKAERNITEVGYKNSSAKMIRKNSVVMAMTGATVAKSAIVAIDTSANQSVCAIETDEDIANFKFVYYCLANNYFKIKASAQGALTSLNLSMIKQIEIPIPSISEQNRIVGILDTFTASIDNLKKQIAQRRKQYEYYRDQLLDLEGKEGVERLTLKDGCEVINGRAYSQPELLSEGKYRVLRVGNFFSNDSWYYSDLELDNKYYCERGDLLYAWSASFGPHIWEEEKVIYHYHIWKMDCGNRLHKKFMYYWLQSDDMKKQAFTNLHGATMAHLTKALMESLQVPVPTIQEQQRIVSILDTFEASIQNLEAQLSQREKQYEYYRNKLLTFE